MTSRQKKLDEFARAWVDADRNYSADVAAAEGNAPLLQKIEANWWRHQANWSMAATAALEANNEKIQAIFDEAKAANDAIKEAREKAEGIAKIVRSSSAAATALSKLLEALAKA